MKWLSPSLSDLFFLFITAWIFLVSPLGWERLLLDTDTALHIATGQIILSTGSVPTTDPFSFSKPGEPWRALEWGSEALFAWLFNTTGFKGITLLAGVIIALLITLLLKYAVWKGANGMIALVVTLIATTAISIHFFVRPHLFTLLFLAIAIWLVENNRRNGGRLVWLLIPLTVLWTNLHPGFVIFFILLALRALGCAGEAWLQPPLRQERRHEAIQLVILGAACSIASLANPYGFHFHIDIFEAVRAPWTLANATESKSPSFRTEEIFDYMILLFAGLASVTSLARKKRLVEPLWILFLAYCSLVSVRHITLFAVVASPIIAVEASEWWASVAARWPRASILGMLDDFFRQLSIRLPGTSFFIPVAIVGLALAPGLHWPSEYPEAGVPIKMIERHLDLFATGRVFASDQMAGYLIFRNYPRQPLQCNPMRDRHPDRFLGSSRRRLARGRPRPEIHPVSALATRFAKISQSKVFP